MALVQPGPDRLYTHHFSRTLELRGHGIVNGDPPPKPISVHPLYPKTFIVQPLQPIVAVPTLSYNDFIMILHYNHLSPVETYDYLHAFAQSLPQIISFSDTHQMQHMLTLLRAFEITEPPSLINTPDQQSA